MKQTREEDRLVGRNYRRMRQLFEQSNDLAPLSPFQSWLDCITNTSGYDFRKGQLVFKAHARCPVNGLRE